MEFHQLVQEISCVQESVMPTPTGSALKPICPPSPLVGEDIIMNAVKFFVAKQN